MALLQLGKTLFCATSLVAGITGCATRHDAQQLQVLSGNGTDRAAVVRAQETIAGLFPPRYRATQRSIITVRRRQFTCDGALMVSPDTGCHLAVVSSLGLVTDLRVNNDGGCEILKVTPLFHEAWSRQFVARDLRWLFLPPANPEPAGRLADGRIVLQTRAAADGMLARYVFASTGDRWQELELVKNGRSYYHVTVRRYGAFGGIPAEVPCEFDVAAGPYRLDLRIVELTVPSAPGREGPP